MVIFGHAGAGRQAVEVELQVRFCDNYKLKVTDEGVVVKVVAEAQPDSDLGGLVSECLRALEASWSALTDTEPPAPLVERWEAALLDAWARAFAAHSVAAGQ